MLPVRLAQWLFAALLIGSLVVAFTKLGEIQIDTNLGGISPNTQNSAAITKAIKVLQDDVESRLTLLISGADEDQVYDAHDSLRAQLANLEVVQVHPSSEQLSEQLIQRLRPYRFSLLTADQRQHLLDTDAKQLAAQARDSLYSLTGRANILSFQDDPFGVHSATLMSLFGSLGPSDQLDAESASGFAIPISMSIRQGGLNLDVQNTFTRKLDALIAAAQANFSVSIDRSGVFFFAAHAAKQSKSDISLISTGSSIGVALLLLLVFRSFKALLLPVASVVLGVGFAFIASHLIYGKVHILTIVFGASLIGVVIDYSLHYFYHSAQNKQASGEKKALLRALTLSLLTSLIGYSALGFSGLESLQKVAVFSCFGLFMAWLSVICLGDMITRAGLQADQSVLPRVVKLIQRPLALLPPRVWAVLSVLVIVGGLALAVLYKPFNDSPKVFFNAPKALLESEQRVAQKSNDYEPGRYVIVAGDNTQQVYQRYAQLSHAIQQSDLQQGDFTSVLAWVPSAAEQAANYSAQGKLYSEQGALTEFADLLAPANRAALQTDYRAAQNTPLSVNELNTFLAQAMPPIWLHSDDQIASFVLIKKGTESDRLAALTKSIEGITYINTLAQTQASLAEQRRSAGKLLLLAYLLVGICLLLRFRSVRDLWLLSVPMSSSAMLLIVASLTGIELNLFHIMALFLVLGFGMDYSIFVREMGRHRNVTLQAILLSALTSVLSFGLLGLSAIPIVASFGLTLFVGNSFNLIAALVFSASQTDNSERKING